MDVTRTIIAAFNRNSKLNSEYPFYTLSVYIKIG